MQQEQGHDSYLEWWWPVADDNQTLVTETDLMEAEAALKLDNGGDWWKWSLLGFGCINSSGKH